METKRLEIIDGPDHRDFMQSLDSSSPNMWQVQFVVRSSLKNPAKIDRGIPFYITGIDRHDDPRGSRSGVNWKFRARNTHGKTVTGEYNTDTKTGWYEYDQPTD